jgi:hypothetical protein
MKALAFIIIIIFLFTHSGCATLNQGQMQPNSAYPEHPNSNFDARWKKEEKEWLLMVAIVLGLAIVLGATIAASSGGNGLSLGINN